MYLNHVLSLPPGARAAMAAASSRLEEQHGNEIDPNTCTDDELATHCAQAHNLICKIRVDAREENRELNQREQRRIEELQETCAVADVELDRREQAAARTSAAPKTGRSSLPVARPAPPNARNGLILNMSAGSPSRSLFGGLPSDWKDPEDFFRSIVSGLADPRLLRNASGTEGTGVDGGFSVPAQFFTGILDQALQQAEFAPRARVFPTSSNNLTIPMPDMQNRTSAIAGISGNWAGENQTQTAQVLKWRAVELKLNKIFILGEASSELVEDGLNYTTQLTETMSAASAYSLDDAFLGGSGAGMPLGILNSASAIEVNEESGQAAATVVFANITKMYSRLAPSCQKRAVWYISPSVLPQLIQMTFPGGTQPVLLAGGFTDGASGTPVGTIFGRPVVTTEIAKALGSPGDITLADMSQYAMCLKNGARLEYSISPGFDRDVGSWRLILRVSGQPLWNTAITPHGGGPTLSWATYLAARS